jgi:DNA-binding transcriptional MerR regulator/methylmalonyl-CoA mutase cobalamin-binding subunit
VTNESTDSATTTPRHPIAVVAERTGLSQDVLRVWERRYRAVAPSRTAGGERLYSDADIERLRLLDAAVNGGRRIGRVVELSTTDLARLVDEDRAADAARAFHTVAPASDVDRVAVDEALERVRALDARGLDDLLRRNAALVGVPALLERTVTPLLRQIGEQWHQGRLSIAEEHMASAVIEAFVLGAMRAMAVSASAPQLLVATPPRSRHVLGAALVAAAAAADGWRVVFLGGDVPAAEISRAAIATGARAVAVSVVYADDDASVLTELRQLREALPAHVALVAGGQAVIPHARVLSRSDIEVGATVDALRATLRRLAGEPR